MASPRDALLILDMVSEFRFPEWQPVLAAARRIAPRIEALRRRAHAARIPVIYVNDFGTDWEGDQAGLVRRSCFSQARGGEVVRLLQPAPRDYFIFKPRHSGFYATALPELLERRGIGRLVLTGLTSHQCVLFTAVDAHVRDYDLAVPPDCIGAPRASQSRYALQVLRESLGAHTPRSASLRLRPGRRPPTA